MGPVDEKETMAFNDMAQNCKRVSSAVGWAISLGKQLTGEKTYVQGDLFKRIMDRLSGVDPRLVTGYSVCIFFAEKVSKVLSLQPYSKVYI